MRFVLLLVLLIPALAEAQLQRPASWRTRVDGASTDTVHHVQMPPGWHVTTGPGTLLYDPANTAHGRFAVAMDVFLFPGKSQSGYGLFVGGTSLDGAAPAYVSFTATRDGSAAIELVQGERRTALFPLARAAAVKPHPGNDDTVLNTLTVRVEPDSVRFEANGARIAALPRGELPLDGVFGFRVGPDVNLHISNLDYTTRLAPAPRPRR